MTMFKKAILIPFVILVPQIYLGVHFRNQYGNFYAIGFCVGLLFEFCCNLDFIKEVKRLSRDMREVVNNREVSLEEVVSKIEKHTIGQ